MIIGACPYCDAPMFNPIYGGTLPAFQKFRPSCCNNVVWLRHSRIDPVAYTEENFLKEYKINGNTIEKINEPVAL